MKSIRRHELQENVLGMKLAQSVGFFKRNGRRMAWVALLAVLVLLVITIVINRQRQKLLTLQAEFDSLIAAQQRKSDWLGRMRAIAEQTSSEPLAALACVAVGDEHARMAAGVAPAEGNQRPAEAAAQYYRKVLAEHSDQTLAVGQAHYGLAKLAETQGNLDEAKAEYEKVAGMKELSGYPVVFLAAAAMEQLPSLADRVRMAQSRPATMPATLPASLPASLPSMRP